MKTWPVRLQKRDYQTWSSFSNKGICPKLHGIFVFNRVILMFVVTFKM